MTYLISPTPARPRGLHRLRDFSFRACGHIARRRPPLAEWRARSQRKGLGLRICKAILPLAVTVFIGSFLSAPVSAAPRRIVLTVQTGPVDQAGDRKLAEHSAQVISAMNTTEKNAVVHGDVLRRLIEALVSESGSPQVNPQTLKQQVNTGRRHFIEGEYDAARKILQETYLQIKRAHAAVGRDPSLRDSLHRAMLFLAQAHLRLRKRKAASGIIKEVIKSFPDREPSLVQYGPELMKIYRRLKRETRRSAYGSLEVVTQPPRCSIFLNGRYVGLSPLKLKKLASGTYQLYVQRGDQTGRAHRIEIDPASRDQTQSRSVAIDFSLDQALRTSEIIGLHYPDEQAMLSQHAEHLAVVGKALNASEIFLLEPAHYQGQRVFSAKVIDAERGTLLRSAMVPLSANRSQAQSLSALGRFLLTGVRDPALMINPSQTPKSTASGWSSFFRWATLGAGVSLIGGGIPLMVIDGQGTCSGGTTCRDIYQTKPVGLGLTIAGAVLLGTSAFLFYKDWPNDSPRPTTAAVLKTIHPIEQRAALYNVGFRPQPTIE